VSLYNEDAFVVSSKRGTLYLVHERPKELELKEEEDSKDLKSLFSDLNQNRDPLTQCDLDVASDDLYFYFS